MESSRPDRKQLERKYVELAAIAALSQGQMDLWKLHTVAHRVSVHRGAVYVMWKMAADDKPVILDSFTASGISISWKHGVTVELASSRSVRINWTVQQFPTMLADKVFIWTPFFPDVRYEPHPHGEGFLLRASLCVRLPSHPDAPVAGDVYFMPVGEFRGRFPRYSDTQF